MEKKFLMAIVVIFRILMRMQWVVESFLSVELK